MQAVADGRDLFTFNANHPNAVNGQPCNGLGYLAGPHGAVPQAVIAQFPGMCTECGRANRAMTYANHVTPLYKFYCAQCP